ncbi:hypothetical protein KCV05_g19831, partial [Aureobasidium melanogenum]
MSGQVCANGLKGLARVARNTRKRPCHPWMAEAHSVNRVTFQSQSQRCMGSWSDRRVRGQWGAYQIKKRYYATSNSTVSMADYRKSAYGPVAEYDRRVKSGVLKDDQHQRTIIESLQDLHDMLANYNPPTVQEPSIESLQPKKQGFLSSIFGGGQKSLSNLDIPSDLPKGLYMYGDVGSGKTMMMDLFYDTLPESIQRATRIHFHNFMQEVHRDL